jgi:hypothetical protein
VDFIVSHEDLSDLHFFNAKPNSIQVETSYELLEACNYLSECLGTPAIRIGFSHQSFFKVIIELIGAKVFDLFGQYPFIV